jgi:integrase
MAAPKGIKAVEWLSKRAKQQRGGNDAKPDGFDRSAPDALALWRDAYLDQLRARNYAEGTLEGRRDALKVFLAWASERGLSQASQITRPILEFYQRALWRSTKANGQRLGWSTQRTRLSVLKDFFRWLTKQNVILHNPASELELPRMEKRLPTAALTLTQVEALLAVPNVADPLGVRDRAMLELFYSCGLRRAHARRRRGHPLHPAVARTREARDHRHLHRSQHQAASRSSRPLPSIRESRGGKTAFASRAERVISRRDCRRSKLLSSFSCRAAVSGPPAHRARADVDDLPRKNSRRVLAPSPIGSPLTATPFPLNVHARFAGLCLHNRIGSG